MFLIKKPSDKVFIPAFIEHEHFKHYHYLIKKNISAICCSNPFSTDMISLFMFVIKVKNTQNRPRIIWWNAHCLMPSVPDCFLFKIIICWERVAVELVKTLI